MREARTKDEFETDDLSPSRERRHERAREKEKERETGERKGKETRGKKGREQRETMEEKENKSETTR